MKVLRMAISGSRSRILAINRRTPCHIGRTFHGPQDTRISVLQGDIQVWQNTRIRKPSHPPGVE